MTPLPKGITEEIIQDIMKHTGKSRDDAIKEINTSRASSDEKELNLEKMSDPNYLLAQLPKLFKGLQSSLNPVKFDVRISNVDSIKLADLATLGKKWEDLDND